MKTKTFVGAMTREAKNTLLLLMVGLCASTSMRLRAATLSEVLEQGIYSEQTKGDLDSAMQAYQQVVNDAKSGETLAAQAQYRLGVCYYKKKDYTAATAAFEKLVQDYPNQKDLVRMANEYLTTANVLVPVPWVDGEELQLDVKFPTGFKIGTAAYRANAAELDGRKIWRLNSHLFAGIQQWSIAEVEADSFKPIHSHWKHVLIGDADAVYSTGKVDVKMKGSENVKTFDLDGVIWDNEEVIEMMRRLPISTNSSMNVRIFASLGGGAMIPIKLNITSPEKVQVPAGTFDCYKVELSIKQTFWYSADEHRYLVKFEAGGVVAELAAIRQSKAGQSTTYQDPTLGFSLTLPWGWMLDRNQKDTDKSGGAYVLLDSEATAVTQLTVRPIKDLKPEAQKSVRAWADVMVVDGMKRIKDLAIRQDSWSERQIGGHPAVSVTADCKEGDEKRIVSAVWIFGDRDATELWYVVPPADFETFQAKFDAVVNSYMSK